MQGDSKGFEFPCFSMPPVSFSIGDEDIAISPDMSRILSAR